ncbi:MAG: carbohydrate ABC transporter permease [Clostridia bacterium]|nr:carbohydrate ABC transporter permease [Clostridia bacterium]
MKSNNGVKQKRLLSKSERTIRKEKTISFVILFIVTLLWMLPLIYMVGTSFKSDYELQAHPEKLFPSAGQWTLKHYQSFLSADADAKIFYWLGNSLWSTLAHVLLTVALDLLTAFVIVFLNFKGKEKFVKFLYMWMAAPGVIGTAPMFAIFAAMRNGFNIQTDFGSYVYIYFWIIMPGVSGIFNMLLMRNFFLSIPKDIVDSARSDGASNFKIFVKIILPLARSTILLIVLFTFTSAWNSLNWPQLIFSGESQRWWTVTIGLRKFTDAQSSAASMGVAMATSVFAMLPIIIVFLFTQNKMIDGMASTGIKG